MTFFRLKIDDDLTYEIVPGIDLAKAPAFVENPGSRGKISHFFAVLGVELTGIDEFLNFWQHKLVKDEKTRDARGVWQRKFCRTRNDLEWLLQDKP